MLAAPAVAAVAGRYRITTDLQRSNPRSRGRARPAAATPLRLDRLVDPAPDGAAGVATQYRASVTIPGYTSSGRNASRATWWPARGDSVVVHIVPGGAQPSRIQLRGAVDATGIRGEVWMLSLESGSTYQLGSFTATRVR